MEFLIFLVFLAIGIWIAFLPSIIASKRNHRNLLPIMICNIIGFFTIIPWFIALVWSVMDDK